MRPFANTWRLLMAELTDPVLATGVKCRSTLTGRDVRRVESRAGGTVDMRAAQVAGPSADVLGYPIKRGFSMSYAAAECLWYLSGENRGDWLVPWSAHYEERFAQDDGLCWGAYGPRLMDLPGTTAFTPLETVARELEASPESRQCVAPIFAAKDRDVLCKRPRVRDMPCTLSLQFFVEDGGEVSLVTTMRSNDLWLGFPYDVFCFTTIQRLMAARLGRAPGGYFHQAGSLHLYDKNRPKWSSRTSESEWLESPAAEDRVVSYETTGNHVRSIFSAPFRDNARRALRTIVEHALRYSARSTKADPLQPLPEDRALENEIHHSLVVPYGPIMGDLAWAAVSRRFAVPSDKFACKAIALACRREAEFRADS